MTPYAEALTYLYQLPSFQYWLADRPVLLPELRRFRTLLRRLESPHRSFQSVHIAGTKGKGTVSAIVASIFAHAGHRTGLYTSPHLHTFRERIQVNGEMVSEGEVASLVDWIRPVLQQIPATTFEAITAIAFEHFRRRGVEIAVLEVGLGGRFDATNVVHPLVSVITSIGLDHTNVLGNTLSAIASEKGGIIKRGVPVVLTPQEAEAAAVLSETARHRRSRKVLVGKDWRWERDALDARGQHFTVYPPKNLSGVLRNPLRGLFLPLLGKHQLENATAAIAAVSELKGRGFDVTEEAVRRGLDRLRWPARLEVMQQRPWLVVDSAHTVASVAAALNSLGETFGRGPEMVIFGASADKDVPGILRAIPTSAQLILTEASHPRAMPVDELESVVAAEAREFTVAESARQALEAALSTVREDGGILAVGSVFLAAEVREAWLEREGRTLPPGDPV